jgi:hypothetical protein
MHYFYQIGVFVHDCGMNICILYVVDLKSSLGVIVKQETIQKRNETKRDTTETKRNKKNHQ